MRWRAFASTLFISGSLSFFAQADVEKDQEQASPKPGHYENNGEHLAGHAAGQCSANRTTDG